MKVENCASRKTSAAVLAPSLEFVGVKGLDMKWFQIVESMPTKNGLNVALNH